MFFFCFGIRHHIIKRHQFKWPTVVMCFVVTNQHPYSCCATCFPFTNPPPHHNSQTYFQQQGRNTQPMFLKEDVRVFHTGGRDIYVAAEISNSVYSPCSPFRRPGKTARQEIIDAANNDNEEEEQERFRCCDCAAERRRRLEYHHRLPPLTATFYQQKLTSSTDGDSESHDRNHSRTPITLVVKDVSRGTSKTVVVNGYIMTQDKWPASRPVAAVRIDELCWAAMSAVGGEFWWGDFPGGRARLVYKGRDLLHLPDETTSNVRMNTDGEVLYYCCLSA
jgi:hypothetical protein